MNARTTDTDEFAVADTREGRALIPWASQNKFEFSFTDLSRVNRKFPDNAPTHGKGAIKFLCPFHKSHTDVTEQGTLTCVGVDSNNNPFSISCTDSACKSRLPLDFIGEMKSNKWIAKLPDVADPYYQRALDRLHPNSPAEDVNDAEELIHEAAAKDSWSEKQLLQALGDMQKRLGRPYSKAILADMLQKARAKDGADQTEKTKPAYEIAIDKLTPDSFEAERSQAMAMLKKAQVQPGTVKKMLARINKNAGINDIKAIKKEYKAFADGQRDGAGELAMSDGYIIFRHFGTYHFDAAWHAARDALLNENHDQKMPVFSLVDRCPARMHTNPVTGRVVFEELTADSMWGVLNERLAFVLCGEEGDGDRQHVPNDVSKQAYLSAHSYLDDAPEVVYTPLMVGDGQVIAKPGYYGAITNHPNLNLVMADTGFTIEPISTEPTYDEMVVARDWLKLELLSDFPFLDHDNDGNECREPSEANAFSMILTPFMRRMINGLTPVFFIAKPQPGTGGTLLGKVPLLLCDGVENPPVRYSESAEEMNKGLISAILIPRSHLFFDDVKDFNNRELLRAITSRRIGGRKLGGNASADVENNFGWIGTGNNPDIKSEMERRIVWINLNAKSADIQKREFRHENFEQFVLANRAIAVHHILTMIQYWISKDSVPFELRKRASFEDWSAKVGGVLQACEITGFLDSRRSAGQDVDEGGIKTFVREWLKKYGINNNITPSDAFKWAMDMDMDIVDGANDDQKKQRFYKKMTSLDGRTFKFDGDNYMVRSGINEDDNPAFYLVKLDPEKAEGSPNA